MSALPLCVGGSELARTFFTSAALVGAVMLLTVVALAASAVPVRRALRVDPTDTLRAE
jgi:ABC-type antimicrobial peptide transport system permease subunit